MGIVVENVTKIHQGKKILDNINLVVEEGDFSVLLAPTGSMMSPHVNTNNQKV